MTARRRRVSELESLAYSEVDYDGACAINIHESEVIGHDILTDLNHDILQEECFVAQDSDGLVPSP